MKRQVLDLYHGKLAERTRCGRDHEMLLLFVVGLTLQRRRRKYIGVIGSLLELTMPVICGRHGGLPLQGCNGVCAAVAE